MLIGASSPIASSYSASSFIDRSSLMVYRRWCDINVGQLGDLSGLTSLFLMPLRDAPPPPPMRTLLEDINADE